MILSNGERIWRGGKLSDMSLFGTAFIEEGSTGRAFGFHTSMLDLANSQSPQELEGQPVRFSVSDDGQIVNVELATSRKSRRPPGKEVGPRPTDGRRIEGTS